MTAPATDADILEIEARHGRATGGEWRSMRQGNQYVEAHYIPTAKLVGASYIDGLARPWNPHSFFSHTCNAKEFETVRLKDDDADFVVAAHEMLPSIVLRIKQDGERIKGLTVALEDAQLTITEAANIIRPDYPSMAKNIFDACANRIRTLLAPKDIVNDQS